MPRASLAIPTYVSQFTDPSQWRYVNSLMVNFPTISSSDFQKRGGDNTDSNLLVVIDSVAGARIPTLQLEEDGVTIQPQVCQMMDLMHRRGVNAVQIAAWWFESRPELGNISPAAHLETTNNRNRILTSTMQATGPYYWMLQK